MGLWSWLTSGAKTAETAADTGKILVEGLVSGLDKVWYTDEEKAEARQKAADTLLKYWEAVAKENTEQSKARRELAKMAFTVYFGLIIIGVVCYFWQPPAAQFIFQVVGKITWLITMIAGIYFGPHQISKIWSKGNNQS